MNNGLLKLKGFVQALGFVLLCFLGGLAQAASYNVADLGMVAQPGDERVYVMPSSRSASVGSYNGAPIGSAKISSVAVQALGGGVVNGYAEQVGSGFSVAGRSHRVDANGYTIIAEKDAFSSSVYYGFKTAPADIYTADVSAANLVAPQSLLPAVVMAGSFYQRDYYTLTDSSYGSTGNGEVLRYTVSVDDYTGARYDLYTNPDYDARLAADWSNSPGVLQGLVRMVFTVATISNGIVQSTAVSTSYFKPGVGEVVRVPSSVTNADPIRYLVRYSTAGAVGQISRLTSRVVSVVDGSGAPVLQPWAEATTYNVGGKAAGSDVVSTVFGDPYIAGKAPLSLPLWGFGGQQAEWQASYSLNNFVGHPPEVVWAAKTPLRTAVDVAAISGAAVLPRSLIWFAVRDSFSNPIKGMSFGVNEVNSSDGVQLEITGDAGLAFAYLLDGYSYTASENASGFTAAFSVQGAAQVSLTVANSYHYMSFGTWGAEIGALTLDPYNGSPSLAYYFSDLPKLVQVGGNPFVTLATVGVSSVTTRPTTIDSYGVVRFDYDTGGVSQELHASVDGQLLAGVSRSGNPIETTWAVSKPNSKWFDSSSAAGTYFLTHFDPAGQFSDQVQLDVYTMAGAGVATAGGSVVDQFGGGSSLSLTVDGYGFMHETYSANSNVLSTIVPSADGSVALIDGHGEVQGMLIRKHANAVTVNNRIFRYYNLFTGSASVGITGNVMPIMETGLIAFDGNGVGVSGLYGVQMVQEGQTCGFTVSLAACSKVGQTKVVISSTGVGGAISATLSDNKSPGIVYVSAASGYISSTGAVALINLGGEYLLLIDTGEKASTSSITGVVTDATNGQYGTVQATIADINDANWNPVGDGYTVAAADGSFSFANLPDGVYNIGAALDTTGSLLSGGQNGFDPLRHPVAEYVGNPITISNGVVTDAVGNVITSANITVAHLGNNIFGNVTNSYSNAPVVVERSSLGFGSIWDRYTITSGSVGHVISDINDSVNNYLRACVDVNGNGSCDIGEPVDVYANPISVAGGTQAGGVDFNLSTASPTVMQGYNMWFGTGKNVNNQWMQFDVQDPNQLAQSVTVTGGGFVSATPLIFDGNSKNWNVQDVKVTTPVSYTVTISNKDGTSASYAVQASGYVANMATITAPVGGTTVNGDLAIGWTGTLQAGQIYRVQLVDKYGWHDITPYPGITTTSWTYKSGSQMNDGKVLAAGSVEVRVYIDELTPYGSNNAVASRSISYNTGSGTITSPATSGVQIHVQDVYGNPVQGAKVYVPGSPYNTLTDITGNGSFNLLLGTGYQLQVDTGDVTSTSTVVGGWWLDGYTQANGVNIGGWDFTNSNVSPLYTPQVAGEQLTLVLDVGIPVTVTVQDASYATVSGSWASFGTALDTLNAPHSWISMGATNSSNGMQLAGALLPGTYVIMDSNNQFAGAPAGNNTMSSLAQQFTIPANAQSVQFIIVQDAAKQGVSATMTVQTVAATNAIITLHDGWNLIGIPVSDTNYATPDTLAAGINSQLTGGMVASIWSYDGKQAPPQWLVWYANNPAASNLVTLTAGVGYWIDLRSSGVASLTLTGVAAAAPVLNSGWNLLSGSQQANDLAGVSSYLQGVGGSSVWSINGGVWESYITNAPLFLNSMQSMDPKRGYYVFK